MKRAVIFAVMAGIALAGRIAWGDIILTLDDLSTPGVDVTIPDNSALDSDPAVGQIGVPLGPPDFFVGSYLVEPSTFGLVYNDNDSGVTDIHLSLISSGNGQFQVALTATDFAVTNPQMPWTLTSRIGGIAVGGTGNATIAWQHAYDPNNGEFSFPAGTTISSSVSGGPFGAVLTQNVAGNGSFSISQQITITTQGSDQVVAFDSNTEVLKSPEPASLALWLLSTGTAIGVVGHRRGWWNMLRRPTAAGI